jgi:hypothetical protein
MTHVSLKGTRIRVVRTELHRATPRTNPAPNLIPKFAVAMMGRSPTLSGYGEGPDWRTLRSQSGPLHYERREIVECETA